ncbi:hypothetical protein [Nocardiopsis lambiniae]|uniref:Fibronectin type-III domain-containing protein n=1 Tax=Nocardiopsis lambiniae TaxID=3075539 RepID=A0ABU2M5F5_9ACTN|nr:hypothetical protein [Nocardiopsis sp. DSM 44743]MDT0327566.1 hypothetical protein [Nocardiopsis sp. DSM 44743]
MPWDVRERRRYEDEVLAAARTCGPPADLFTRYGVGPALERRLAGDPEGFIAHVTAVCTYWRGLQTRRRTLRRVLVELIAAHERLGREGALTHEHFRRVRAERTRRAMAEWADIVDGLTTTLLDRWALRTMAGSVGVPEADAERLLRERGVRVVERLPEPPVHPPIRTFRSLRDNLRTRGAVFSPEVVFGAGRLAGGFTVVDGFRLADGGVLDDTALSAAIARVQVEPMTEGKAAAESVLGVLRSCSSREERDAVALWEVAEDLRARPAELSEAALARPWVRRGLTEAEATLLAAAVRRRPAGSDRISRAEREVRDLLADDQLRQAQAAMAELPPDHGLIAQVRDRAARVEELSREAEGALGEGRDEAAARALAQACALAADDEVLRARLGEVPPSPPREVRARVEGLGAVVVWRPSPSLVGRIGYRVVRRIGRSAGARETPMGEVTGTELIDPEPPVGAEIRYTVRAVREDRGLSEAVETDPVMLTPEVEDLCVRAGEHGISGSWRVPREAVRVEVVRGEGAPPRAGDGTRVTTDGMGFTDPEVRPDVEYYYRVRAVYLTSGGSARGSEGLVRRVVPGPPPSPVTDLLVVPDGEGGFVASWTPPPRGRVSLRVDAEPPPWPAGAAVPPAELAAHGSEPPVLAATTGAEAPDVTAGPPRGASAPPARDTHTDATTAGGPGPTAGAGEPGTATAGRIGGAEESGEPPPVPTTSPGVGRARVRIRLEPGTHHVVAVTSRGDQVVVGDRVRVAAVPAVTGLRAQRFGDVVRLAWVWPEEAATAVVAWRPAASAVSPLVPSPTVPADGPREAVSDRPRYEAEGGFEASMGPGPVRVTVRSVVGGVVGPPTALTVPGWAALDYHVSPAGLLRREREIVLVADTDCVTPEIAVVYAEGAFPPDRVDQGRVLAVFPPHHLSAGQRSSLRVRPPRAEGTAWLVCLPVGEDAAGARLCQPSVKELRL